MSNRIKPSLIVGGAGFIGSNLAMRLCSDGQRVVIYDDLSRAGSEKNLDFLQAKFETQIDVRIGDILDCHSLIQAVKDTSSIFHLAAQVAVTNSLKDPFRDFEINALGTLNLLEILRKERTQNPLVFVSTNKVYGSLRSVDLMVASTRNVPSDITILENGFSEQMELCFETPYGCSKAVADQYVIEYCRSYGINAVVLRLSCTYGCHQNGNEDQGWVTHFLANAILEKEIHIYGNGKQVRDLLFVEDLVDALLISREKIKMLRGQAFNIGGGPKNSVSLIEIVELIGRIHKKKSSVRYFEKRLSDQDYYVSDSRKFSSLTGWSNKTGFKEGILAVYNWLRTANNQEIIKQLV